MFEHRANIFQCFLKGKFGKRFIKHAEWPPPSRDYNPLDDHFCNKIIKKVYEYQFKQPFGNWNQLKRNTKRVWPEKARGLTEIRKALKQFLHWIKVVESIKRCYSDKMIDCVFLCIIALFIYKLVYWYFMVLMWCYFIMLII